MPPKAKAKQQEGAVDGDEHHARPGPRMTWTEIAPTNATNGRTSHQAVLHDGRLMLFGGWGGAKSPQHIRDVTYYDHATRQWASYLGTEGPHHPGSSQSAMVEYNGQLYFFGGWTGKTRSNDVSTFNLEKMLWSSLPTTGDRPPPLTFHSGCLANKRFYVFGGNTFEGQSAEVYYLDLNSRLWAHAASLGAPTRRSSHSACMLSDTILCVFGGRGGADGNQALNDLAIFDTSNNHWLIGVKVDGAPPPRYGHSAIALRNKMIVFGGVGDQGQLLNDTWVLEMEKPTSLFWSRVQQDGAVPSPRTAPGAIESLCSMYVVGGRTDMYGKTSSEIFTLDLSAVAPVPATATTVSTEDSDARRTSTSAG